MKKQVRTDQLAIEQRITALSGSCQDKFQAANNKMFELEESIKELRNKPVTREPSKTNLVDEDLLDNVKNCQTRVEQAHERLETLYKALNENKNLLDMKEKTLQDKISLANKRIDKLNLEMKSQGQTDGKQISEEEKQEMLRQQQA